jgi:hypothetical protein
MSPSLLPATRGKRSLLMMDKLSADTIERADLFTL